MFLLQVHSLKTNRQNSNDNDDGGGDDHPRHEERGRRKECHTFFGNRNREDAPQRTAIGGHPEGRAGDNDVIAPAHCNRSRHGHGGDSVRG